MVHFLSRRGFLVVSGSLLNTGFMAHSQSAQAKPQPPAPKRLKGFGDPAAVIVVVPNYQHLATLTGVEEPIEALAESLVRGRYEVRILVGSNGTEKATLTYDRIRQLVQKLNEQVELMNRELHDRNAELQKHGIEPLEYHKVELSADKPFTSTAEMKLLLDDWMSDKFPVRGTSAPFGLMAFRGHGVYRQSDLGGGDIEDVFLGPTDTKNAGGLWLNALANKAKSQRIPLLVLWDVCRGKEPGDKPTTFPPFEEKGNPQTEKPPDQNAPLVEQIEFLRNRSSRRTFINTQPINVIFSGSPGETPSDIADVSSIRIIANAFQTTPGGKKLHVKTPPNPLGTRDESEANVFEVFEYFRAKVVRRNIGQKQKNESDLNPVPMWGPIDPRHVIYSLRHNHVYLPTRANLLGDARFLKANGIVCHQYDGSNCFAFTCVKGRSAVDKSEKAGPYVYAKANTKDVGQENLQPIRQSKPKTFLEMKAARQRLQNPELEPSLDCYLSLNARETGGGYAVNHGEWVELVVQLSNPTNKPVQFTLDVAGESKSRIKSLSIDSDRVRTMTTDNEIRRFALELDGRMLESTEHRLTCCGIAAKRIDSGNENKREVLEHSWNEEVSIRLLSLRVMTKEELIHGHSHSADDDRTSANKLLELTGASGELVTAEALDLQERWWPSHLLRLNTEIPVDVTISSSSEGAILRRIEHTATVRSRYAPGIEGHIAPATYVDLDYELQLAIRKRCKSVARAGIQVRSESEVLVEGEILLKEEVTMVNLTVEKVGVARWLTVVFSNCKDATIEKLTLHRK